MSKNNSKSKDGKFFPFVSICTPTFNRRPFIPIMLECFRNQTYPRNRMEWIVVDDGTDKVSDLIWGANIPEIKYFAPEKRMNLGEKRNFMHTKTKGSIIVYMDDDDYYPPERVEHAVERLLGDPGALCAGSSEIYIFFKHIQKMYQCGPYGPNHATAGTFAFKRELLDITRYDDNAAIAEEKAFLKNYSIPFVQLDPMKTILVFSHIHNTFDKRKMLENLHPDFCKESPKTVELFIRTTKEASIKKFFMEDIEALLEKYRPGKPDMKPEVLKQIKKIEKEREKMLKEQQAQMQNGGQNKIMMNRPGEPPVELNPEQVVAIIQQQQQQIELMTNKMKEQDKLIIQLRNELQIARQTPKNPVQQLPEPPTQTSAEKIQHNITNSPLSDIKAYVQAQSQISGISKPVSQKKSKNEPSFFIPNLAD
jgi:glycosyltransferase involved in cell wall biosynthesis